ncbi:hypothetical protein AB0M54_29425 [Actinoplanes sp. NPDC051470]|uniref:hypothetical protein n=1 Tax=Actinoplanes sp. NPDC051470 TaxID=3157224 RepID=UPI00343DC77D
MDQHRRAVEDVEGVTGGRDLVDAGHRPTRVNAASTMEATSIRWILYASGRLDG